MPKRTKQENKAIHDRMVHWINDGYPVDQAQAIAFRQFRDGELDIEAIPKLNRKQNAERVEIQQSRREGSDKYYRNTRSAQRRLAELRRRILKRRKKR